MVENSVQADNSGLGDGSLLSPWLREGLVGHGVVEAQIRKSLEKGQLKNGWMISGPRSVGKATLAHKIARAYLVPEALCTENTLKVRMSHSSIQHIMNRAHPDLFVLERVWQEKANRHSAQITIDQVRELSRFFALTSSTGRRVVIIDAADDLNHNAANALLKSLEEPPKQTLILLVSHAPGKLLPTLKSRCRALVLKPVDDTEMRGFLKDEGGALPNHISEVLKLAQGCPGYALELCGEDGNKASRLAISFFRDSLSRRNVQPLIEEITAKATLEEIWPHFERALLGQVGEAARISAIGGEQSRLPGITRVHSPYFAEYWFRLQQHFLNVTSVHLDKSQVLLQIRVELEHLLQPV